MASTPLSELFRAWSNSANQIANLFSSAGTQHFDVHDIGKMRGIAAAFEAASKKAYDREREAASTQHDSSGGKDDV